MSAPVCHRLMGMPVVHTDGDNINTIALAQNDRTGCLCLGSLCALWVPEIESNARVAPRLEGSREARYGVDSNYNTCIEDGKHSGRGWCAENLRRTPFADPAKPADKAGA